MEAAHSYAQSLSVRVKVILLIYARSTVALGRAVYPHDRKKTSRPEPNLSPPAARARSLVTNESMLAPCPLMALSGHRTHADECPLSGVKRT